MAYLYCKSPFYRTSILLWLSVGLAGLLLGALPAVAQTGAQQNPPGGVTRREAAEEIVSQQQEEVTGKAATPQGSMPERQRRLLLKDHLENMRRDAGELANLTKALQEELNKANENVLALDVVAKADKIQKLAKKLKASARGI